VLDGVFALLQRASVPAGIRAAQSHHSVPQRSASARTAAVGAS